MLLERSQSVWSRQRTNIGGRIHGVADLERRHTLNKFSFKLLRDPLMHDETLGGNTRLSIIDDPCLHGGLDSSVKFCAGHDDEGITAAELEHRLLDLPAGNGGHVAARTHTAGQGVGDNATIRYQFVNAVGTDPQRLKNTLGEACLPKTFFS